MEDIEECFTKFFLQQAVEIEPSTVQALIDHGFKSKVALLALDLIHDLPQITEVPLAQKAILRKYISTLQNYSPFTLSIDEEALKKYKEPNKPSKKRKLENVDPESSDDENFLQACTNSFHQTITSLQSNRNATNVPALTSKTQSPGRVAFNGILLPESPVKPQRVSIKYNQPMSEEDSDMQTEEEVEKISNQSIAPVAPTAHSAKKGGKGKTSKKEVVRTKSQILFEMKKHMKSPPPETAINEVKKEVQSPQKSPSPPAVVSNRRSVASTPRTPSTRRATNSSRRAPQPITIEEAPAVTPKTESKEAKEPGHVPTPAELAIRARIEAKKQADAIKGKRRASKKI